jgi:flavin-dependent dehydrogenase
MDQTDVIVVGARCAGSPLAALLARQGIRVVVLERDELPSETLSSHLFEADALAFLNRLGLSERLHATGAPMVNRTDMRVEDVRFTLQLPHAAEDIGAIASVRRSLLDSILAEAAADAGAEVRTRARVTGLLEHQGRVVGVRYTELGNERELRAPLVVGADGRHSTVARLCGARRYNVTPNQRLLYWAYFEGARPGPVPTFLSHRWGDRFILAIPSDGGLYQVLIWPEKAERDRFRSDLDGAFIEHARACEPLAEQLSGSRQVGKVLGAVSYEGFFREASGPGWVLTGDAGHFKSPAPGRGIGDAFLQVDRLAAAIAGAIHGPTESLDAATRSWGRWRDREFAEHYWLAYDFEEAGEVPLVLVEILRQLDHQGKAGLFFELLNHRIRPLQVLTPARIAAASARLLARRGTERRELLAQLGALGSRDLRRRRLGRRPIYAPSEERVASVGERQHTAPGPVEAQPLDA